MIPVPYLANPKDILQSRGILEQALRAGWVEQEAYWRYPVLDRLGQIIAEREKRYPFADTKKHKAKVRWHPSKPDNLDCQWYILPKGYTAIRKTGVMYLCNGEPSVLAMHAGGIDNVGSTTLSEIAFPKEGISFLKGIGVNRIVYLADKDAAGLRSAINWRDSVAGSGIDFVPLQWPDYLSEKSDANDALIYVHSDKQSFQEMIAALAPLELPVIEKKAPKQAFKGEIDNSSLIAALRSALENGGYLERKVYQGVFQECHCPFHEDKESSAGFSLETGVINCMGRCGRAYSPKEVAERLGIHWQEYYPQKAPKKIKKQAEIIHESILEVSHWLEHPAKPIHINTAWIDQPELPVSWVKGFLHICHGRSVSPVYAIRFHRAIRKGLLNGTGMTIKDIMRVLDSPRLSTQSFIDLMLSLNFLWIIDTISIDKERPTVSINKSKGRPEIVYALNTHTASLAIALAERLGPILLERLTEDLELAPRNHLLRDALDLDLVEFKAWAARTNTAKQEYISEFISERVCDVLENTSYIEFTDYDLEHPSQLRGKLIKLILEPYSEAIITLADGTKVLRERTGLQLSRAKLAWELGCSESALSKLYEENNIGSKEIYAWYEVVYPNGTDIEKEIREAPYNINKEIGGVAYGGVLHYWDYGILKKTKLLGKQDLIAEFEKRNHKIEKLYLQVQQPSLLWNMNAEEIENKRVKEAQIAKEALETAEDEKERETALKTLEKAQGKQAPKKKTTVSGKDRLYTGLSPEFVFKELEKEVRSVTPYIFKGLSIIDESTGEIIYTVQALKELVIWLNRNATKKEKLMAKKVATAEAVQAPKEKVVIPEAPKPSGDFKLIGQDRHNPIKTRFSLSEKYWERADAIDKAQGRVK